MSTIPNSKELMKNTKKLNVPFSIISVGLILLAFSNAFTDIRVSRDWGSGLRPDGSLIPDSLDELGRLQNAAARAVLKINALPDTLPSGFISRRRHIGFGIGLYYQLGHKLFIDSMTYYLQPMTFMAKSHPDEVCTPVPFPSNSMPTYQCKEGQRETHSANIFIFNSEFEQVGYHKIHINQPWPLWCNSVLGVGSGDKKKNEVLVTVQYFPVDKKVYKKKGEIGSEWERMTVLLRVSVSNGKVNLEQDDRCLGNPNQIESIPDARKKLKQCAN
jgi:hypothetical protein